ncbi:ribosomal maturation YjgA family protein [Pedobacter sp. MW01-1-1]|uniref:ribosomal maturation YjgA family protein n=1 Tax=Pedobacter sp. MW01-1-1 TaxID=3383027 RepID=UPI003FF0BDDB
MKLTFNLKFFFITILIFLAEVFIGLYLHDAIIRPFGGDVLVVVLIYSFLRTFLQTNYQKLAFGVLLFSFVVEFLQALNYVNWFGWEHNPLMSTILGTYFSVYVLLAYSIGYVICLFMKD